MKNFSMLKNHNDYKWCLYDSKSGDVFFAVLKDNSIHSWGEYESRKESIFNMYESLEEDKVYELDIIK